MIKIDFGNGFCASDRSLSKIFTVNYEDKDLLLNRSKFYFEQYNSNYTELTPENLVIYYKIIPKRANQILDVKYNYNVSHKIKFPSTMDLYLLNKTIDFYKNYSFAYFVKDGMAYNFEISKNGYICTIKDVEDGAILYSFTDKLLARNS